MSSSLTLAFCHLFPPSMVPGTWNKSKRVLTLTIFIEGFLSSRHSWNRFVNREGSWPASLPLTFSKSCFVKPSPLSSLAHAEPEEETTYLCDCSQPQINQHWLLASKTFLRRYARGPRDCKTMSAQPVVLHVRSSEANARML